MEFLDEAPGGDFPVVQERCSSVVGSCSAYLEMITPHARFKLRELLTQLQTCVAKHIVTKSSASSSYSDLQSILHNLVLTVSK